MDDWHKMQMLLNIIHMAAAAGPAYAWVVTAAEAELQSMMPPPAHNPPIAQHDDIPF